MVQRLPVKEDFAGSNPARGANQLLDLRQDEKGAAMFLFVKQGKNREPGSRKISVRKFICDQILPAELQTPD